MSSQELPPDWVMKESKSNPGKFYYFNTSSGESSWEKPASSLGKVRVRHILKKHNGSRRPASWYSRSIHFDLFFLFICGFASSLLFCRRNPNITQSKEEAISQITAIKENLSNELSTNGYDSMHSMFQTIASKESDCSSAERGGDLDFFSKGQMQKAFEDVSFSLNVGELSGLVDSDSGIHVLLRIA